MVEVAAGPAYLRHLRLGSTLTQEQLAGLAGLHVRTIRGLETGQISRPRRTSLTLIATALGLSVSTRREFESSWGIPDTEAVGSPDLTTFADDARLVECVAAGWQAPIVPVSVSECIVVDERRRVCRRRTEELVVALRGGIARRNVVYDSRHENDDIRAIELVDLDHCYVAREHFDRNHGGVKIFELAWGRALDANETHLLRYTADFSKQEVGCEEAATPESGIAINGFFRPPTTFLLEIQFSGGDLPRACEQVFVGTPTDRPNTVGPIPMRQRDRSAHLSLSNPRPGGHGIRWIWSDELSTERG